MVRTVSRDVPHKRTVIHQIWELNEIPQSPAAEVGQMYLLPLALHAHIDNVDNGLSFSAAALDNLGLQILLPAKLPPSSTLLCPPPPSSTLLYPPPTSSTLLHPLLPSSALLCPPRPSQELRHSPPCEDCLSFFCAFGDSGTNLSPASL